MSESKKIYPEGVRVFDKNAKAPDYVICSVVIEPAKLVEWLKGEGGQHLTDYKGAKQIRLQLLQGNKGPYACVDTYRSEKSDPGAPQQPVSARTGSMDNDDLPF